MRAALLTFAALSLAAQDERIFVESMVRLERQDPAGRKDLEDGSPVRKAAMALDPTKASEKACFTAASWLWATNMMRGFHYGKDQTYLQAIRQQPDLLKAWSLLQAVGEGQARPRNSIRLELAWRLLDLEKMRSCYAAVSTVPNPDPRELVHCYFVSAHLGDWAGLNKHAEALVKQGGMLGGLHAAAENTLTMFDYESLLKAVNTGNPKSNVDPLTVRSYRITKWRIKVKSTTGSQLTRLKALNSWPKDWVAKPDSTVNLLQVGAAAHWVEGVGQPPVSGYLSPTRMLLFGYRDSRGGPGDSGRQEQRWDMHPDPQTPHRWQGINELTARLDSADPKAEPALHVVFDVEWDLVPQEDYPEIQLAAPPTTMKTPP